jgi:hypothetical protein
MSEKNLTLFDASQWWEEYWDGMPEFRQEKKEPYAEVLVRFASAEDLEDFASKIGQKLGGRKHSIWHPRLKWAPNAGLRWESEE